MSCKSLSSGVRGIVVLAVATIVAVAIPGYSFVHQRTTTPCFGNKGQSTHRKTECYVFNSFAASNGERSLETNDDNNEPLTDRRAALLAGAASIAAGFVLNQDIHSYTSTAPAILSTLDSNGEATIAGAASSSTEPLITAVSDVNEALSIIESRGDKRFLHAMVASDYKFLYEQSETVPSEIDAAQIFSKTLSPSNNVLRAVHLAATGSLAPPKSASLWPLMQTTTTTTMAPRGESSDIHYAWPEQGGLLSLVEQESKSPAAGAAATIATQKTMIVDGIDCGKMSLEDALEGDMQVLVHAPTYLSVPSHMEAGLRKGLQGAFLI